jgi:hypothetical protein
MSSSIRKAVISHFLPADRTEPKDVRAATPERIMLSSLNDVVRISTAGSRSLLDRASGEATEDAGLEVRVGRAARRTESLKSIGS